MKFTSKAARKTLALPSNAILSSMMTWMRQPGKRKMEEVMLEVVAPLSQQISQPAQDGPAYGDCNVFDPIAMMRKIGLPG